MAGIREIAKIAGVSQATVSRVLNRDANFSVSQATRNTILKVANELHYNPKSSVKSKSVDKLSVVIITTISKEKEINEPFFISIRNGIEKEANEWGIRIMNQVRLPDESFNFEELREYGGVIVVGAMTEATLQAIYQYNSSLIVVDEYRDFPKYDVIRTDFAMQTKAELDLLYAKGHRKIAYIGGSATLVEQAGKSPQVLKDIRQTVYEEWMSIHMADTSKVIIDSDWSTESGVAAAKKLLDNYPAVTAVVVGSDPVAIGVYRGLQTAGKSIPDDIAVFSFDDVKTAEFLVPSLSTVRPASEEMGKTAIRLIRDRLFYHRTIPIEVTIPSELMVRESI